MRQLCEKCLQPIPPTQAELDAQARRCLTDEEYATYCRMREAMVADVRKMLEASATDVEDCYRAARARLARGQL